MRPRQLSHLLVCILAPLTLMGIQCDPPNPGELPTDPVDPVDPVERPDPVDPVDPIEPPDPVDSEDPVEPEDPEPPPAPEPPAPRVLTADLIIESVSVYQAVEIPLDPETSSLAPIIAGRDALIRAFVAPLPEFQPRRIQAALTLTDSAGSSEIVIEARATGRSAHDDLDSTLNFEVPGAHIASDTTLHVRLFEIEASEDSGERAPAGGMWPAGGGSYPLAALDIGDGITVRIVPMIYRADGSQRAPDTTSAHLDGLRSALLAMSPAPDATVWVDAPVQLGTPISPNGDGWSDALVLLTDLREERAVRDHEYVYGLVSPASDFGSYCGRSCVAGLSWRASSPDAAWARTSMGLGYPGESSEATFVHELGHAHGRMHTPCGEPASPDPDYPHTGGLLGGQGYDMITDELVPESHGDLMGYCRPRWVSDYTFAAFADRMAWVHAQPALLPAPGWPREMLVVDVSARGVRLAGNLTVRRPPHGPTASVDVLDGDGELLYVAEATVQEFEHTGSQALLVSRPEHRAAAALRVDGVVVAID